MKKLILAIMIMSVIFLTACSETPEPQPMPPETLDEMVEESSWAILSEMDINVYFDEENTQVIITPEETLNEFHFVEIEFRSRPLGGDLEGQYHEWYSATVIESRDELLAGESFVTEWQPSSYQVPTHGIVFWYDAIRKSDGMPALYQRFFAIRQSEYDGSLYLTELSLGWLSSYRTEVTGILQYSGREVVSVYVTAWSLPPLPGETYWRSYWDIGGLSRRMSDNSARRTIEILSTLEATEVLTPFHREGQHADAMFSIEVNYVDGTNERVQTVEGGPHFFRFTNTRGNHGDQGYVIGVSEELNELLWTYF